jgi:hypothetical protein
MSDFRDTPPTKNEFAGLLARFRAPIMKLDCGQKCAPYNENGVPFCCDLHHAVPTLHRAEWEYLQENTDLWRLWQGETPDETRRLQEQTPAGQVLAGCLGADRCQREFRSLTCRSFPFFPYLDRAGSFIGLSYYWEYEDRCWVISNLDQVTPDYLAEFISAYEWLFERLPQEKENFKYHSSMMRRIFSRRRRAIPLLHRNGSIYKIAPSNGRLRRMPASKLPKFGPYAISDLLLFPDDLAAQSVR